MLLKKGGGAPEARGSCSQGRAAVPSKHDDVAPMGGQRCCRSKMALLLKVRAGAPIKGAAELPKLLPWEGGGAAKAGRCCY